MQHATVNRKSFGDQLDAPERCVGYGVYDALGQRIGKAEKIFVNGNDEPEYVRVKMRLLGLKSVLIPVESVATDQERRTVTLE